MDPFGFVQITYTIPLYGYRYDTSKPDKGGWKRYPYDSQKDADKKAREATAAMIDSAKSGFNAWKNGASCSDIKTWGMFNFQVYAQFMAALKWNNDKGIFQGMGGGQLRAACSITFTMNFYAGPVPILISFGFIVDVVVALMCDVYSLRKEATDMPLSALLPTYLLDVSAWRFDFDNSGLTVSLTLSPSLSVGVGVAGIASISLKGKAVFTMSYSITAAKNKPNPHTIMGYSASVDIVIQIFIYTQTYNIPQLTVPYTKLHDNWDGLTAQADTLDIPAEIGPGKLSDFMGGMQIVTSAMLAQVSEANGAVDQSLAAQAGTDEEKYAFARWLAAKSADVIRSFASGQEVTYTKYRFKRPRVKAQAEDLQAQAEEDTLAQDVVSEDAVSQGSSPQDAASEGFVAPVVAPQDTAAEATSPEGNAPQADAPESVVPEGVTAQVAVPESSEPQEATAEDAAAEDTAGVVSFWHTGSSVRYEDRRVVGAIDGLAAQADGFSLPEPGVKGVSVAGGVIPSSDMVILTNDSGNVLGDPRIKIIDISTSTSSGTQIRATCSFRIGTVEVPDVGMRSRIIMTVLDASDELSWFKGMQRVIEFDIYDADIDHADLFDYDFGLAFSSYSESAGGIEGTIDQVEIVLVSGTRSDGDDTSVIAAGTDMYFTYLQFYAQDLLSEDFNSAQYLQLTLPANQVIDPTSATGDGLVHSLSNICCVASTGEANGSLLVSYLDRAAQTAEAVFSDDADACVVLPRFLVFRSDVANVDVMVPDSSKLDGLLQRLERSDASVMRLTLSPRIGGLYTLALQAQTTSYLYVVDFDAESATLTQALPCQMPDSSLNLVPWPEQDCFLTSFASAEYRASDEFKNGNQNSWDRSKWVLQKAWWEQSGDSYALGFEEIGPTSFNFSRFALNSGGTFIFWPEGRTGSDEHLYDAEGNHTVSGENDAVYRIMACRVRNNADGSLHFSDPFIAADLPHSMDSLEAVATFDRYAPFEVLSTELVDTGERMINNMGQEVPLFHAARLWYTSVPNLQCATVVGSSCTLPAVSAGGTAKFDVTIRNDGNSFLSGCHLQMYVHEVEVDEKGNALRDESGAYIDRGVKPVANAGLGLETTELDLVFADALQASAYNRADDDGNPTDVEPDRALAPGKRSVYRVEVPIPAEWGEEEPNAGELVVKYISFHATNPVMAEGGGLAALAEEDAPVFQQFSVEPGSYPVAENRVSANQGKDRRFTERLAVESPSSAIAEYADAPTRIEGATPNATPNKQVAPSTTAALPKTADPTSALLPAGLGLAGAALAAYGKRRAENERREAESED